MHVSRPRILGTLHGNGAGAVTVSAVCFCFIVSRGEDGGFVLLFLMLRCSLAVVFVVIGVVMVTLAVSFYMSVPSLTLLLVRPLLRLPSSPPPPPLLLIRSKRCCRFEGGWCRCCWTCWGLIGPDRASFFRGLWSWSCFLVLLCVGVAFLRRRLVSYHSNTVLF
jgi:hypothetical protein